MKKLQDTRYQLTTLKADPGTPKMIQKVICAMEKHAELDKVVRDWRKQDAAHKKVWKNVKNTLQLESVISIPTLQIKKKAVYQQGSRREDRRNE